MCKFSRGSRLGQRREALKAFQAPLRRSRAKEASSGRYTTRQRRLKSRRQGRRPADGLDGVPPFEVGGFRQDDVGVLGDLTEIHVDGDDELEPVQGLTHRKAVGDGLEGLKAVGGP